MGFAALLTATAVMYRWNITIGGMGNQFYAAAAQAGSTNWEALPARARGAAVEIDTGAKKFE